ncbi:transcriptional regulator GlxA family with amidase domain [Rhizobium sp. SG_E_25_P2]|uniref:GlxA family transcriptional regulator n=1 Tax=Rhizobium sp. SG_E_25_P2 TaxID=2879942 RepID=UPI002474049B|nr:GlxA family transcriptional regulator [Rhizobium sp. SG_E_25_P2]MDH6265003.1 transcriptional regulator GlxA family with amidase domain [Rhizobium sp. SG_E_25_P2]
MMRPVNWVSEVGLLIYPDCQLSAVYGLTDLFRIASQWAPQQSGQVKAIRVSHWQVEADDVVCVWDSQPEQPHRLGYIIAPPSIVMPAQMQPMPAAASWIVDMHAKGATACSICAGAFVLAETGLVDGRRVTTHWAFSDELAARFPKVDLAAEQMVIDDGDVMTAGGILAWTDLGLTLVEKLMGVGTMLATARFLLVDPPRRDQDLYKAFIPKFDHGDAAILGVQHHIQAQASEAHDISELARRAGLAERTFLRRFTKATGLRPTEYLQQIRVMKARDALETTNRSVEQISWDVGYSDATAFRRVFQRLTSLTPTLYRQRFGVRRGHEQ